MIPPTNTGYGALPLELEGEMEETTCCGLTQPDILEKYKLAMIMLLVICLGPVNFVLYKVMFESYGEDGSFFVSNAVNVIYVVVGGVALLYADKVKGEITEDVRQTSHLKFVVMAAMDALAGFLAAMGAVYTSGAVQQLLNQTLIPWSMLMSFLLLGKPSSISHVAGAVVILFGVGVVLAPHIFGVSETEPGAKNTHTLVLVSSFVYCMANLPTSIAFVYKEFGFKDLNIHPVHLTQWVSVYQCLFGLLLMPLQMLPGMGSENGMTMQQSWNGMQRGWQCFMEQRESCAGQHSFLLLVSYCAVNFLYNLAGLYLVKHGSSVLNAISGAIILPLTVLSFTLPLLGPFQERFDWLTVAGLCVVLTGFSVWKAADLSAPVVESTSSSLLTDLESRSQASAQSSPLVGAGKHVDLKEKASKEKAKRTAWQISFTPRISRHVVGKGVGGTRISFQERVIPGVVKEV